jgi:hypothetical protein
VATPARTSQGLLLSRASPLREGGSRLPSSRQLDRCRQRDRGSVVRPPSNRGEVAPPGSISAGRLNVGSLTSHMDETTSWTPSHPIWPAAGQRGGAGPDLVRQDTCPIFSPKLILSRGPIQVRSMGELVTWFLVGRNR